MSNHTMNCGQVRRLLPPFLDEELSGRARDGVVSHLASCPTCRSELEALKADMGLLEQVRTPEVTPFLVTRVMAEVRRLAETEAREANAASLIPEFGRLVGTMVSALAVAVSISAGVFFGSGLAQTSTAAANNTEAAVSYVESSTTSMCSMMSGGN